MKTIVLTALVATLTANYSFGQSLEKDTLIINDSVKLFVGEDILINKPAAFDFVNIQEVKKGGFNIGKLANIGSAVGSTIGIAGANASSVGAMTTGIKVMNTASVASSVGWTQDAINALNVSDQAKSIVGKKMRILKFKKEGNEKRGEHFYAIVAGEGKHDYKIEVELALQSEEIKTIVIHS